MMEATDFPKEACLRLAGERCTRFWTPGSLGSKLSAAPFGLIAISALAAKV